MIITIQNDDVNAELEADNIGYVTAQVKNYLAQLIKISNNVEKIIALAELFTSFDEITKEN